MGPWWLSVASTPRDGGEPPRKAPCFGSASCRCGGVLPVFHPILFCPHPRRYLFDISVNALPSPHGAATSPSTVLPEKKCQDSLCVSLFQDILSHTPFTSEGSNELTEGVGAVHPGVQLCDAPAQPARVSCSSPPHTHPLAPLARQEFLTLVILTKPLRPASIARIWGFDCAMCVCVRVVGACVYGMGAEVIG